MRQGSKSPFWRMRDTNAPIVTWGVLLIVLATYIWSYIQYGTTEEAIPLILMGARNNYLMILNNEWWRLLSAAFLHIGLQHLVMNSLSIYFVGIELEPLLGHWRFAVLYLVSAIGGNIFSFALNGDAISAGASTALFGLFAAFVILAYLYPESAALRQRGANFLMLLVINLVMGINGSGSDNWGHFGGIVYGVLVTFVLGLPRLERTTFIQRLIAVLALVGLSYYLINLGINNFY